jgi:DNA polymerase III sliding clamp (beta) subunit (PCNA family)
VGFNPRYLIDAAKSMGSSEVIEMQTDPRFLEPLMLSDDKGGKVLVMPMRI